MNPQEFSLRTLHLLDDGALEDAFAEILAGLVEDCLARPRLAKKRQVALVVDVTPEDDGTPTCAEVRVQVQVTSKCPAQAAPPYVMRAGSCGGLTFSPGAPGNPDQGTLDLEDGT